MMAPNTNKLVVTDQAFGNTTEEAQVARKANVEFSDHQCTTESETIEAVRGASVVLNNFAPMTRLVMESMAPGATIIRYGVGVDNVDLNSAKELGIRVCNVPDYGIEEVADHAAAAATFLARKIHIFDNGIRSGEWKIHNIISGLRSLRDTTVGMIGFGRIAQAFASRMNAFGCSLIAYDPYVDPTLAEKASVALKPLDEVISASNVISLHVPLIDETRHIINGETLSKLPDGAVMINASRGGLIDQDALTEALVNGKLSGACLDVFETEPLPENSPLRAAPNLFMSPHAAFFSDASVQRLQKLAAEEAYRALLGEELRSRII